MRFGPLGFYRVAGDSMTPGYRPGDVVIARRWINPQSGQVVVVKTPERLILKRIKRVAPGMVWLEGDNQAHSTDSRQSGAYPLDSVEAVVIWRL